MSSFVIRFLRPSKPCPDVVHIFWGGNPNRSLMDWIFIFLKKINYSSSSITKIRITYKVFLDSVNPIDYPILFQFTLWHNLFIFSACKGRIRSSNSLLHMSSVVIHFLRPNAHDTLVWVELYFSQVVVASRFEQTLSGCGAHFLWGKIQTDHWGPCVVRGPVDGRFLVWWVIDNGVWTDSWLSIAGVGCGLTGVSAGEEQAWNVVADEASKCGEDK
jgi:hypothetical protein